MTGTITLGGTLPAITSILTITGPTSSSSGITIDGSSSVQIMQINSGANVTLQFLALQNGRQAGLPGPDGASGEGGAIFNSGTLTIANCTLSNNQAIGGDSIETGGGGGAGLGGAIFNLGTLTITGSTLSSNQATGGAGSGGGGGASGEGGAIFASGTVTVTNITFSGNLATGGAGSPVGQGTGGAIFVGEGTLTSTNATFSDNRAINGGPTGGAIASNRGAVNLKGAIFAASVPSNCGAAATAASFSIADDATCFTGGTMGNAVVTNTSAIGLATALANNGGPTQTIALQGGGTANAFIPIASCTDQSSPAVTLMTDQRGFPRPAPSHSNFCSAGAFEYSPPFFNGEASVGNQTYYLTFFGYYSYEFYPWLYHFGTGSVGLGFEYVFDANDAAAGVYLYDNGMKHFLYTNPSDFPIMYDFSLTHWLYYFPGTSRTFYDFTTGMYFSNPPG
ncbi:MAG: choice-of-anchor Q domain-containing protein [Candidatus Binataceae bacterium]